MNNLTKAIKNKLIEITLKRNRLLGRIGLLPAKTKSFGKFKDIIKILTSSNISLQLYKEDGKDKDFIFSVIRTLEKNGVQVTLIEFDKIFSSEDLEEINKISKTAKIDFRYVYPSYLGGTNISTQMDISSYLETLKKIKHIVNVTTSNFNKKDEQVIFIANQIAEYVTYDVEYYKKSEEDFLSISSLQGCLEGKTTVCAGVAFAFERCMTEIGIDNMLIQGYHGKIQNPSILDSNHVWNKVRIDGKWYNVDATNIIGITNPKFTQEEKVKTFILTSDQSLSNVGSVIVDSDYANIPKSKEDFPGTLKIYHKIAGIKNVLNEYDNGNMSTFLKYNTENTPTEANNVQPYKKLEDYEIVV